jgi:hypothetical protein
MRNLPLPSRDSAKGDLETALVTWTYRGVVKGYAASAAEIQSVLELYDTYDANNAVASKALKGGGLPKVLNEAIKHAYNYTQGTRKLSAVRAALFSGVKLCPICGIDTADELDHHLPISKFFPLAIYARNLVPLCNDCNGIKLAKVGDDAAGAAHFLHAYFDLVPDIDFIHAKVEIVGEALVVDFFVAEDVGVSEDLMLRLTTQMQILELNARYKAEMNTYLVSHTAALHMLFAVQGQVGVKTHLRLQARKEAKAPFHRNHWRTVVLRALADYDDFTAGGFAKVLPVDEDMLADLSP